MRFEMLLPNLDDFVTREQRGLDARPEAVENLKQVFCATVPQPDPDEPCAGLNAGCQVSEIFILGDEDFFRLASTAPDFNVGMLGQARLGHMPALRTTGSEEAAQGNRELIINREAH